MATTDCLCGAGVDANTCFTGTYAAATGVCKPEVVAAAGADPTAASVMADLQARFFDTSFPIGASVSVIETCDQFFCADQCL